MISEADPLQPIFGLGKRRELQINFWGEELCGLKIKKGDVLLVLGARTTDNYGNIQLNISAENGKVLVNPKGY